MIRAVVAAGLLVATAAHAQTPVPGADKPKKDRDRAGKSTKHGAVPVPGTKPIALINLYNGWNDEWLALRPDEKATQPTIERFLRCHYTNEPGKMDPKLIDIVVSAAQHFKSDRVTVVSGFRHPKYNLLLRKKGHQVARDSEHTHGNAIDFQVAKVTVQQLHAWAKEQAIGGVGLYLKSQFVHMDTGKIRYWSGE
ncbi:MAG TPA: DUF882 domain-containing protein [Kofleriaceae bacterium]|nr:DUF882 domain-containing protein [Kofleriaceae bacterium]